MAVDFPLPSNRVVSGPQGGFRGDDVPRYEIHDDGTTCCRISGHDIVSMNMAMERGVFGLDWGS